jgi:hypothetical protein
MSEVEKDSGVHQVQMEEKDTGMQFDVLLLAQFM